MSEKLFKKMTKTNDDEKKSLVEKCLKLAEETGELSAEILKLHGRKGSNGKKVPEIKFEALLEIADMQLILYSICAELGYGYDELCTAMETKHVAYKEKLNRQEKWESDVGIHNN